ncbi:MAG: C-terminal binding protein [Planctomycetes bacterium]|nr:C-terminal binding protein [Planctomycetota bacterium]
MDKWLDTIRGKAYHAVSCFIGHMNIIRRKESTLADKIKIVITDHLEPDFEWELERLPRDKIIFETYQLKHASEDDLIEKIKDADLVVVNMAPMTERVIESLERCKTIIRHGIGYDNVDLDAATKKGIRVANIPDYCPDEVAEHAIELIFAATRKVFLMRDILVDSSREGRWDFEPIYPIYSLKGKTLGIVGCGRIGSRVLKKMSGFEMNIIVCDPYLSDERKKELGIEVAPFEQVLREADVITMHTPLTDETRGMIGETELRAMKETAFLINTSRGPVVDLVALAKALREGWIAGAGIDVYEQEPPPLDMELFQLGSAVLTPHLGWYSEESNWSIREKILEDMLRFIDGKPPRFVVNKGVEDVLKQGGR